MAVWRTHDIVHREWLFPLRVRAGVRGPRKTLQGSTLASALEGRMGFSHGGGGGTSLAEAREPWACAGQLCHSWGWSRQVKASQPASSSPLPAPPFPRPTLRWVFLMVVTQHPDPFPVRGDPLFCVPQTGHGSVSPLDALLTCALLVPWRRGCGHKI